MVGSIQDSISKLFDWDDKKEVIIDSDQSYVSYVGWNSEYTKHLPLNLQRTFIGTYTDKHGIVINDYQFENEYLDYLPNLHYLLKKSRKCYTVEYICFT